MNRDKSLPELYQLSNQEMLKRRLYQDAKQRVMMELFDKYLSNYKDYKDNVMTSSQGTHQVR